jgi:hypothetical protein
MLNHQHLRVPTVVFTQNSNLHVGNYIGGGLVCEDSLITISN